MIAHRLQTARGADRILVVDAGQIVEDGEPRAPARRTRVRTPRCGAPSTHLARRLSRAASGTDHACRSTRRSPRCSQLMEQAGRAARCPSGTPAQARAGMRTHDRRPARPGHARARRLGRGLDRARPGGRHPDPDLPAGGRRAGADGGVLPRRRVRHRRPRHPRRPGAAALPRPRARRRQRRLPAGARGTSSRPASRTAWRPPGTSPTTSTDVRRRRGPAGRRAGTAPAATSPPRSRSRAAMPAVRRSPHSCCSTRPSTSPPTAATRPGSRTPRATSSPPMTARGSTTSTSATASTPTTSDASVIRADLAGLPARRRRHRGVRPAARRGRGVRRKLQAAGVEVVLHRFAGLIHGFYGMGTWSPAAADAVPVLNADLRALLG